MFRPAPAASIVNVGKNLANKNRCTVKIAVRGVFGHCHRGRWCTHSLIKFYLLRQ